MSNKNSEVRLITLSNYVKPDPVVNKSKGYVLNGRYNSFYNTIIERNNGSTTNSSINSSYTDLIYGRGLGATNSLKDVQDWAKLKGVLKDKDLRRIVADFQLFGEATMQVIKTKGGGLSSIKHLPKDLTAPSIVDEDFEIPSYWFSADWSKITQNIPEEFSAFGTSSDAIEIFNIKPYQSGELYFANPSYFSALQYCEVEEEISNLYINSIKNGLSAGYMIEVTNGVNLQPEEKDAFEKKVRQHLAGSQNASQFILSFNGVDTEVKVTPFPVNDNIHKQWDFLNENAVQKILTAHKATSPSLVGIISSSGFSNTAEEMDMAESQLMKRVIEPKQRYILDALEEILVAYDINLDLYFKPLTEPIEAPTQLSEHVQCDHDDGATSEMADTLINFGEDNDVENWTLLCTADVDYDTDEDLFGLLQFAKTGTARPNAKSEQDSEDVKIRYRYVGNQGAQRDFCRKMMGANKLYRKEDIIQMGNQTVNEGFGHVAGGDSPNSPYSIWLYKGGGKISSKFPNGTCRHKWQREIYLNINGGVDVNSPLAKTISTSEARRKGYKVPTNDSDVSITPHNNKS